MAKKSFKALREDSNKHLPTHPSAASNEVPDKQLAQKADGAAGAHNHLPTHPSDASAELPDSLEGKTGARPIKKEFDGKAAADNSGQHGAKSEAKEMKEEEDKEDEKKEEMQEAEDKEASDDLDDLEEAAMAAMEKSEDEDKKEEMKESEDKEEKKEEKEEDKDEMKEHLSAITADFLNEEMKLKVTVLFENAVKNSVNSKLETKKKKLNEAYSKVAKQKLVQIQEQLTEKIDSFLDYIVESWLEENAVAVEAGLRTELAEEFVLKLKTLLEGHFVEVPEAKRDLLTEAEQKAASLEKELNDALNKNIELKKKLNEGSQEKLIVEQSEGLTVLDAEKFRQLISTISFNEPSEYAKKLKIVKESYFGHKTEAAKDVASTLVEEGGIEKSKPVSAPSEMDVYASVISQSVKGQ